VTSPKTIGIAGAGVAGRLLALELAERGCRITLVDRDEPAGTQSCTHVGAGMLAPWCELEHASNLVFHLGQASLAGWVALKKNLPAPLQIEFNGSLVTAHPSDRADLERLRRTLLNKPQADGMDVIDGNRLGELEPALAGRFQEGLFFPAEGHVNNRELLASTTQALQAHPRIDWISGQEVDECRPGVLRTGSRDQTFDWVADCRGLGARKALHQLRGVRGELMYLEAPEVQLHRPVRLMHPRHPIYIVPRGKNLFVVGATSIESDDARPVTVRSALELLSAAYTLHSGFAEAAIVEQISERRPAFPDNEPRLTHQPRLLQINGLYRHGFLMAPALIQRAADLLLENKRDEACPSLYHEEDLCKSA
jgi:glycine oxidase